jgi:hypothetical protein
MTHQDITNAAGLPGVAGSRSRRLDDPGKPPQGHLGLIASLRARRRGSAHAHRSIGG